MIKLFGIILLLGGSTGFAFCLCQDRREHLFLLKEMRLFFSLVQEEIRYSGLPVTEIIKNVNTKISGPYYNALSNVMEKLSWEEGNHLKDVWKGEMEKVMEHTPLSRQEKELFIRFPDSLGMPEKDGQANALAGYMRELDGWIQELEQEEKSKNKVIMSMGMATGILLSVLLL
ncbi:MAG: stage III sporulation protein AB [Lachnospiraceae bacterium]|nr:stage III sporulation protein AB [Lachnospiraceae bacterium]